MEFIQAKMLPRIEVVTESGCWIWMGAKTNDGYGQISVNSIPTSGSSDNFNPWQHFSLYELHLAP